MKVASSILIATLFMSLDSKSTIGQEKSSRPSDFAGEWIRASPGECLPRLKISQLDRDRWIIQAWGDCQPKNCDWGEVPLQLLADKAGGRENRYGFASWDSGFKDSHMIIRIEKGILVAEIYSIYRDGSRRSNYRRVCRFKPTETNS